MICAVINKGPPLLRRNQKKLSVDQIRPSWSRKVIHLKYQNGIHVGMDVLATYLEYSKYVHPVMTFDAA